MSKHALYLEFKKRLKGRVRQNILLSNYVAYKIGGPAEIFIEPANEADILLTLGLVAKYKLKCLTLGSGTNLLIPDLGIKGVVLYLGPLLNYKIKILKRTKSHVLLRLASYMPKASLLDYALKHSLAGLEFSAGIPGTLGGAVFMNAGTKWGSYSEVIKSVRLFVPGQGIVAKTKEEMGFKYRGHGEAMVEGAVVLSVDIELRQVADSSQLHKNVDEILVYRGQRQPLELPNCGSVFKNPSNSELGAGRLIEACSLKGFKVGHAQVSLKHSNFILNLGKAKAIHVLKLIKTIQTRVLQEKSVALETEVVIL